MKTRAAGSPLAGPPGTGEITIRMVAIAVGLSDQGGDDAPPARPIQQAGSGIVSAVGPDTPDWSIGDRAIMIAARPCDGTVTAADQTLSARSMLKVPACLPLAQACMGGLGGGAGWGSGADSFEVKPGHTVVVIGAGAVGLLAVRLAADAGARYVIAADPMLAHHAALLAAGASHVCDGVEAAGALARELTQGRGADGAAITCARLDTITLRQSLDCVEEGGTVVCTCLGEDGGADAEVSEFAVTLRRKRIYGVVTGPVSPGWELLRGVQMHAGDRFRFDRFTFAQFTPQRLGEACAALRVGPNLKAIILFE